MRSSLYSPLERRAPGCAVPLTRLQRFGWDISKQGQALRPCNAEVRIHGLVDINILRRSLVAVVRRHESLRTRVAVIGDTLQQQIDVACDAQLEVVDVGVSIGSCGSEVERISEEFFTEMVSLSIGPLFVAKLIRLTEHEHALLFALSGVICDGFSLGVLNREIWSLYRYEAGFAPPPRRPTLQFADYAVWQEKMYAAWKSKHEAYWHQRLSGASTTIIPVERRTVRDTQSLGAIVHAPLGEALSDRLRDLAQRERTMLPLVMLTVWTAFIARWVAQDDLVVAFSSNARYRPELSNMIGPLANPLFVRIQLSSEDTFIDVLRSVRLEFFAAYSHQEFGDVLGLGLGRGLRTELHFNWLSETVTPLSFDYPHDTRCVFMLRLLPAVYIRSEMVKWACYFSDGPRGIVADLLYGHAYFGEKEVELLAECLRSFAEDLVAKPFERLPLKSIGTKFT